MRRQLSDTTLRAMQPPPKGYSILWDANLRGFGCRISQAGTRAFVVLIESGRPKTIGRYPTLSLADARREARRLLAEKTLGRTHPRHTAFEDALAVFLAEAGRTVRASTLRVYRRQLKAHYPFGRQNAGDITARQIQGHLDPLPISERRHAFAVGRTAFAWMERRHIIDASPFRRMDVPSDGPARSRVLNDDELRAVFRTAIAGGDHFSRITALLVLTGQRPHEIAGLQWHWIREDTIELPSEIAKNKRAWVLPIGHEARNIITDIPHLSDQYLFPALIKAKPTTTVFNSFGHGKARLDKASGVANWQLRDLRRTFATNLQRLDVRLEVTESLLNHRSGSQRGIVSVYQTYRWLPEMREAVLTYERWLTTL